MSARDAVLSSISFFWLFVAWTFHWFHLWLHKERTNLKCAYSFVWRIPSLHTAFELTCEIIWIIQLRSLFLVSATISRALLKIPRTFHSYSEFIRHSRLAISFNCWRGDTFFFPLGSFTTISGMEIDGNGMLEYQKNPEKCICSVLLWQNEPWYGNSTMFWICHVVHLGFEKLFYFETSFWNWGRSHRFNLFSFDDNDFENLCLLNNRR